MSPHDPLCEDKDGPRYGQYCDCRLIDKVRADERERIAQMIEGVRVSTPEIAYPFTHRTLILVAEIIRSGDYTLRAGSADE
jgi:hypothetical protein